jgi:hypothetical protein
MLDFMNIIIEQMMPIISRIVLNGRNEQKLMLLQGDHGFIEYRNFIITLAK